MGRCSARHSAAPRHPCGTQRAAHRELQRERVAYAAGGAPRDEHHRLPLALLLLLLLQAARHCAASETACVARLLTPAQVVCASMLAPGC